MNTSSGESMENGRSPWKRRTTVEFILKASSNRETICFNFPFVLALNKRTASSNNKYRDDGDDVATGSKSRILKKELSHCKINCSVFSCIL